MAIHYEHGLDRTFHALGDGTRRAMLTLLARRGECTASELGKPFNISQPTASKHLGVLERAGFLSRQVSGRVHRFRLEVQPLEEADDWIRRHRRFWEGSLERLGMLLDELDSRSGSDG